MEKDDEPEGVLDQTTSSTSTSQSTSTAQEQPVILPSLPSNVVDDPEGTTTTITPSTSTATTSKKNKKWPAYFFPSLATQRMSFCLDVLKREDIKSVCELGCGQGAVLKPMTNVASHIDAFPESMFDEASLMAVEEEDQEEGGEAEKETEELNNGEDLSAGTKTTSTTSNDDEDKEDSIGPSQSASRRQSVELEAEPVPESNSNATINDEPRDLRERSPSPPPRGRQGGPSIPSASTTAPAFNPARRSTRSLTPEAIASSSSNPKLPINYELLEKYKKLPGPRKQDKELHLRRIAGLDLTEDVLLEAIEVTAPPPEEPSPFLSYFTYSNRDRWEDLRVELWQGSLDVYNDALDNFEAFVMTEVIEHLYPKQLDKFPDILFGSYRPRIIVITTPNYDFNQYFAKAKQPSSSISATSTALVTSTENAKEERTPSGEKLTEDETKNSFKDPTGRTDRYFRDDDHKFEWTEAEFKEWCEGITSKFDYTVEYSGVGSLRNYLGKSGMYSMAEQREQDPSTNQPPPHIREILDSVPDPAKIFATQTAVFRRKYAYESERSPRSPLQMPLAFYGLKPTSSIKRSSLGPSASVSALNPTVATATAAAAAVRNGTAMPSARKSAKQRSNDTESDSSASRSPNQRHKLLKAHYYKAHPLAGNPKSSKTIRHVLDDLMRDRMRLRSVSLRELWGRNEVAQACGGYMNKLIQALIKDPECNWDIEFDPAVLDKGGEMEDAVYVVLKDFVEPEKPNFDSLEGAEDQDDDEDDSKDKFVKNKDDDSDDDDEAETSGGGNETEGQTIINAPPKLSKKQRKLKRMEEAPFLAPIFPIENEQTWMPEKGSEDAKGWEEWTDPVRASTLITEEEWAKESEQKTAPGWD